MAFHPLIVQDLRGLDSAMAQRLFDKTKWIASNIANLRHENAEPGLAGVFKYAVNDWRIFYRIDETDELVLIEAIVPSEQCRPRCGGSSPS